MEGGMAEKDGGNAEKERGFQEREGGVSEKDGGIAEKQAAELGQLNQVYLNVIENLIKIKVELLCHLLKIILSNNSGSS